MILLIDNNSSFLSNLKKYLKDRRIEYIQVNKHSKIRNIMKHKFRGVIISGGPLVYDKKINIQDININITILLDLSLPILGICFGHQTIAEAYDGKIKRLPKSIVKKERIKIIKKCSLFSGLADNIEMQEHHIDCVIRVPYNFEIIATSKSCKIEAIKHKKKHIYGLQFHPEATGKEGHKILDNFMKICNTRIK